MIENYWAFALFIIVSAVTPGPNNLIAMSTTAAYGYRRALPVIMGVTIGYPFLLLMCALGLGAIFDRFPIMHTILKFGGAAYLLFIAWRIATASSSIEQTNRKPLTFWQTVAFQWINPKAWIISIGQISGYTTPGAEYAGQIATLIATNFVMAFGSINLWALGGLGIAKITRGARARRIINIAMGLMLCVAVVGIFI